MQLAVEKEGKEVVEHNAGILEKKEDLFLHLGKKGGLC